MEKIHLEDALEDDPQTKNLVSVFENDVLQTKNYLSNLQQCFTRLLDAHIEVTSASDSLSLHLSSYAKQNPFIESRNGVLTTLLTDIAAKLDSMNDVEKTMCNQLRESFIPYKKFMQTDFNDLSMKKEVFDASCIEVERCLNNYLKFPKKKELDNSRHDVNDVLYIARKKCHQSALTYYTSLNLLPFKKMSAILGLMTRLIDSKKTLFDLGKETYKNVDMEIFIDNLEACLYGVNEDYKDVSTKTLEKIEKIEEESIHKYYAEPLEDVQFPPIDTNITQKAGYLFLRSKLGLLSSKWDRYYFFIQGGNLMHQSKNEVAGSSLLDLDAQTSVEPIDFDDRRFVFQISQPINKKTVVLQAENNRTRDEWIAALRNASNESTCLKMPPQSTDMTSLQSRSESINSLPPTPSNSKIKSIFSSKNSQSDCSVSIKSPLESSPEKEYQPTYPIQFDIITPCEENKPFPFENSNEKRRNPFDKLSPLDPDGKPIKPIGEFNVRFLGSTQVPFDRGDDVIHETIRSVISTRALYNIFKMSELKIVIFEETMHLFDSQNNVSKCDFSLEDISFWSTHKDNKRLFAFISRSKGSSLTDPATFICHVFECDVSGEDIGQTLTEATKKAYQLFLERKARMENSIVEKELFLENVGQLKDSVENGELDSKTPSSISLPQKIEPSPD